MYVITAVAMCFIKCSITCLYRRIFVSRVFALVCNVFIAIVIVWAIAVTLGIIFGCGKRFGQIFPPPGESSCRSYYHAGIVAFSTDIVLDVVLVVLPLPMVRMGAATQLSKLTLLGVAVADVVEEESRYREYFSCWAFVSSPEDLLNVYCLTRWV